MRKYIHMITAVSACVLMTACVEKLGTDPGTDPAPKTTIYQYSPGEGYNSDEDVVVRLVSNGKADQVYYLVELLSDKEAFLAENGEDEYAKKVLAEGKQVPSEEVASYNDTLTGLPGVYAITAAAVSGSKTVLTESIFNGLSWTTLSTGTYTFGILAKMGLQPVQTEFQLCDMDENLYRFKDIYGPGYSLKIVTLPDYTNTDDYGTYTYCRIPAQSTGLTYGSFGEISVRDIGYWQQDESYITEGGYESCYYTDGPSAGTVYVMAQYYVSAGNLGFDYDKYVPDAK